MRTKTDAEILWILKQTSSSMPTLDIVKENDRLAINDEFKKRLRFLVEGDLIGVNLVQGLGPCYWIKNKGEDLIWSGNTRDNILNLLQISEYTLDEIIHFIDDSTANIGIELRSLKLSNPPLVESVIKDGKKYFRLTPMGEQYLREKKSVNVPQTNIAIEKYVENEINITNITSILQKLEKEIENEPNLTPQEKIELQNVIQEEYTVLDKVKDGFIKNAGKFTGHFVRSFAGLDD